VVPNKGRWIRLARLELPGDRLAMSKKAKYKFTAEDTEELTSKAKDAASEVKQLYAASMTIFCCLALRH